MSASNGGTGKANDQAWRRPAPVSRRAAMALYAWREPGWSFFSAVLFALPLILATAFAPALLSLSPAMEMLAPIAEARGIFTGQIPVQSGGSPIYSLLIMAADLFAESPGRIHLVAKAIATALVVFPLAYMSAARLPVLQSVLLTASFAAYVAAPFSGQTEFGFAVFLAMAFACLCAPAKNAASRAWFEGALVGAGLLILWLLSPVLSLGGFMALSACPFLSGKNGLRRYAGALCVFGVLALLCELLWPGLNLARANAATGVVDHIDILGVRESFSGLGGVIASVFIVVMSGAIFGGREHIKSWGVGAVIAIIGIIFARFSEANILLVFPLAASIACFSVASPFYDGLFRSHDRASVAIATSTAMLTLFWTTTPIAHAVGQFALQHHVANEAPDNIRAELGLVQPGGLTIAKWVEEGRFSTLEARELFSLAPVDQSAMLLEAASQARAIASHGVDVAILTGADTACILASKKFCSSDGAAAANEANVVFVPRLDLDPSSVDAKGRSEALLYTKFKLADKTAFWDIWVRRGVALPTDLHLSN